MSHSPIYLKNIGFSLPQKVCFTDFTTQVHFGSRIAIIGNNGSGKSTLLKMLHGLIEPTEGCIQIPDDTRMAYVSQVIEEFDSISGSQRFNKALTQALALNPNVLLLDEPTNHLDLNNRKSLMRMLLSFPGTLIIASHDLELLRNITNILWHIEQGKIHVFSGSYDDYRREVGIKRLSIEQELSHLKHQKKEIHQALMQEQSRAKKSRLHGEKRISQRKWPTMVSHAKARRAAETTGRKKKDIQYKKQDLVDQLSELRQPEVIQPHFSLTSADIIGSKAVVSISNGSVGYESPLLTGISLSVGGGERLAIRGDNGSGKSTLIKAILGNENFRKSGDWYVPKVEEIGYLDQHYRTLHPHKTVLKTLQDLAPSWSHADMRRHLNDFLFRKNEEVNALVSILSGGERVRLSLAQISAHTPKLLLLDEITNNLDLETREHVIQVLRDYPGAMIVISHDEDFLRSILINSFYDIPISNDYAGFKS
jgi:ATPase subunit of ABC transporter with duplicated ATPase domains